MEITMKLVRTGLLGGVLFGGVLVAYAASTDMPRSALADDAPVPMTIHFTQAIELSQALQIAVDHDLAVEEYVTVADDADPTTFSDQLDGPSHGLAISPPYAGGQSITEIESAYWQREWDNVSATIEVNENAGPDVEIMTDVYDRALQRQTELAPIEGCWQTDSCPSIVNVLTIEVLGPLNSLTELPTLEPLVKEVRFANGRMFRSVGSSGIATTEFEIYTPQTSQHSDPGIGEPVLALIDLLLPHPVSARESSPPAVRPAHQADHAPATYGSWAPFWGQLTYTRWKECSPAPCKVRSWDHPGQDVQRDFVAAYQWNVAGRQLYHQQQSTPGGGGSHGQEDGWAFETKLILNPTDAKYDGGTLVDVPLGSAVECILSGPRGTLLCYPSPSWGVPRYLEWRCDLPACFKDSAALDAIVPYGFGTASPEKIKGYYGYTMAFSARPGNINGTGGRDLDNGCMQPQLHWRNPLCLVRHWGCSANTHETFHVDTASCEDAKYEIDPIWHRHDPPPPSGFLWWMKPMSGHVTTATWPG